MRIASESTGRCSSARATRTHSRAAPGVEAGAPGQPVGAGLRAVVAPALALVELAQPDQQLVGRGLDLRREHRDLVAEAVDLGHPALVVGEWARLRRRPLGRRVPDSVRAVVHGDSFDGRSASGKPGFSTRQAAPGRTRERAFREKASSAADRCATGEQRRVEKGDLRASRREAPESRRRSLSSEIFFRFLVSHEECCSSNSLRSRVDLRPSRRRSTRWRRRWRLRAGQRQRDQLGERVGRDRQRDELTPADRVGHRRTQRPPRQRHLADHLAGPLVARDQP